MDLKIKTAVMLAGLLCALFIGPGAVFAADNSNPAVAAVSSNWSGYIAQNGSYTGVSGTWVVPAITPSATVTSNATWIGIGGKTSSDLIQAGVYEIANSEGITYQAWYELLPQDSIAIPLVVSPGDSMSVAILETSQDVWNIVITNNTTHQQFEKTVQYQSSLSSAEWIQERPLLNQSLAPLSGFTSVTFTGATAIQNGQRVVLSQTNPTVINLINASSQFALAVPSPIAADGLSFNVSRTSAPSSVDTFSTIPPFEMHRTGHSITWIIQFPLRKID